MKAKVMGFKAGPEIWEKLEQIGINQVTAYLRELVLNDLEMRPEQPDIHSIARRLDDIETKLATLTAADSVRPKSKAAHGVYTGETRYFKDHLKDVAHIVSSNTDKTNKQLSQLLYELGYGTKRLNRLCPQGITNLKSILRKENLY